MDKNNTYKAYIAILALIILSSSVTAPCPDPNDPSCDKFKADDSTTWDETNINQVPADQLASYPDVVIRYWDILDSTKKEELFAMDFDKFKGNGRADAYFTSTVGSGKPISGLDFVSGISYHNGVLTNGDAKLDNAHFPAEAISAAAIAGGGFKFIYNDQNEIELLHGSISTNNELEDGSAVKSAVKFSGAGQSAKVEDGKITISNGASLTVGNSVINSLDKEVVVRKEGEDHVVEGKATADIILDDRSVHANILGSLTFDNKGYIRGEYADAEIIRNGAIEGAISGKFEYKDGKDGAIVLESFDSKQSYFKALTADLHVETVGYTLAVIKKDQKIPPELQEFGGLVAYDEQSSAGFGAFYLEQDNVEFYSKEKPITDTSRFRKEFITVNSMIAGAQKGDESAIGWLDDPDAKNFLENSFAFHSKSMDYAFGKIIVDDASIRYQGLTDSSQFQRGFEGDTISVKIDGAEDGDIAKFTRKVGIGDISSGSEPLGGEAAGISMLISKDKGKLSLKLDENSARLLAGIENDPDKVLLIGDNLVLELGDAQAYLKIDTKMGVVYEPKDGQPVRFISPGEVHSAMGNKLIDVNEEISRLNQEIEMAEQLGKDAKDLRKQRDAFEFLAFHKGIQELISAEDYDEAIRKSEEFLAAHPDTKIAPQVKMSIAELYTARAATTPESDIESSRQDYYKAIQLYQEAKSDPANSLSASLALGGVYIQIGDARDASIEYDSLTQNSDPAVQSQGYLGLAMVDAKLSELERSFQMVGKALEANPDNEVAKALQLQLQSGVINSVKNSLSAESLGLLDEVEGKIGLESYGGGFWESLGEVIGNTGIIITDPILGHSDQAIAEQEYVNRLISHEQVGLMILSSANSKGYSFQDLDPAAVDSDKRMEMISEITGVNDEAKLDYYDFAMRQALVGNPDIMLAAQNGKLSKEQFAAYKDALSEGSIRWHGLSFEDSEKLVELSSGKFRFKTGEDYFEHGGLEQDFSDMVWQGVDLKNFALFALPGAQLGVVGGVVGLSAEMTVAGALLQGVGAAGKAVVGAERLGKITSSASAVKGTIGSTRVVQLLAAERSTSVAFIDKSLSASFGFLAPEAGEELTGSLVTALLGPEAGFATEMLASHGRLFDGAIEGIEGIAKKPARAAAKKVILGENDEVLALAIDTTFSTSQARDQFIEGVQTAAEQSERAFRMIDDATFEIDGVKYATFLEGGRMPNEIDGVLTKQMIEVKSPADLYAHGSSSGDLSSVSKEGLVPYGKMTHQPFGGEQGRGSLAMSGGINLRATSAVALDKDGISSISYIVNAYANLAEGWTPEVSQQAVKTYERAIEELKPKLSGRYGNTYEEVSEYLDTHLDDLSHEQLSAIDVERDTLYRLQVHQELLNRELLKQQQWVGLSDLEKEAIRNPFPVKYVARYGGEIEYVRGSNIVGEIGLADTVPTSDMVAFVPADKLDMAMELSGGNLEIYPDDSIDDVLGAWGFREGLKEDAKLAEALSSAQAGARLSEAESAMTSADDLEGNLRLESIEGSLRNRGYLEPGEHLTPSQQRGALSAHEHAVNYRVVEGDKVNPTSLGNSMEQGVVLADREIGSGFNGKVYDADSLHIGNDQIPLEGTVAKVYSKPGIRDIEAQKAAQITELQRQGKLHGFPEYYGSGYVQVPDAGINKGNFIQKIEGIDVDEFSELPASERRKYVLIDEIDPSRNTYDDMLLIKNELVENGLTLVDVKPENFRLQNLGTDSQGRIILGSPRVIDYGSVVSIGNYVEDAKQLGLNIPGEGEVETRWLNLRNTLEKAKATS